MSEESLNEKWDMSRVIQNAIDSAHNTPAPETRERLKALEITQNNIMEKLDNIVTAISNLEAKIDKALDKKANVWVETAFTYMLYTTGGIVLSAILYLVINK